MLKKRIIPCLDIQGEKTVKGVKFCNIRDAGNPVELAKKYVCEGADELVFLDITATIEKKKTLTELVEIISKEINIPFTVGGGIKTLSDVREVISAGADKISINSSAFYNPGLISEIAGQYGCQCVVVAIDARFENNEWMVYVNAGHTPAGIRVIDWATRAEMAGAGEILLTSMNNDGTKNGFAIDITYTVSSAVKIPVIASGGAGECSHFRDVFTQTKASAALAAGIFHFGELSVKELKDYLKNENIPVR